MTTDQQSTRSILELKISDYLASVVTGRQSLSAIRQDFLTKFRHPELTIWAPELSGDDLTVVLIEVDNGEVKQTVLAVPAREWCAWERGEKKPLAP
jgi:hypothetical protein